ncbi:nuclear transport factor 2 family protein [Kineosporia mesophila]|nr:nuclear transport factor 2 family protein [Kineosporia mesophila]MCD5354952.1 nuclear transport factor 2 family protein [Kineosporia mesophila]
MDSMNRTEWIQQYAEAWRGRDHEGVVELFAVDAVYHSSPTGAPYRGHEEIAAYWKRATHTQTDLKLFLGVPISDRRRTVVEWWATMRDPDWTPRAATSEVTLPGCLVLTFGENGLCDELWEYYNPVFGKTVDAPAGWGA